MPRLVLFLLLLVVARHSNATYCLCKDGISDTLLQQNIDYACHNGADCSPIQPNGSCYSPSTVKDHCNYAVNSYYQKKSQIAGSCDFAGSATTSASPPPSAVSSGCTYPTSSGGTTTTPISSTTPTTSTTPSITAGTSPPPPIYGIGPSTNSTDYIPSKATSLGMYEFKLILLFVALMTWHPR